MTREGAGILGAVIGLTFAAVIVVAVYAAAPWTWQGWWPLLLDGFIIDCAAAGAIFAMRIVDLRDLNLTCAALNGPLAPKVPAPREET